MHTCTYKEMCVHAHWPPALTTAAMSIDQCCHSGVSFEYFPTLLTLPPFIQTFARTFFIYVYCFWGLFSISVQRYLLKIFEWVGKTRLKSQMYKKAFHIQIWIWENQIGLTESDWFCNDPKFANFKTFENCNFNSNLIFLK